MPLKRSRLLLLNGPNLNLLGTREPEIYGHATLADIESDLAALAARDGHRLECFQSNAEHALVDRIHQAARDGVDCAIINPGAYTHTSVAIRDAFLATGLPFIEIHLSNIHRREPFPPSLLSVRRRGGGDRGTGRDRVSPCVPGGALATGERLLRRREWTSARYGS